ncbi:hypothetical protein HMPREF1981_00898 [Bacteroides pyogenes F0041]|uniref:Uncharacterized protein n=1 Tax=Bacteroides pyogenes F0041 TaxID=1321819 RepID=U2DXV5_9BACE|nr:hypothetical protein [Bacteroides pyogenes]ERI86527.1 hypothetical protein HMPREF1981_00898 [Bacteroides pyogenes F0041]MBB3895138.1 transposase [Bacteroides pyogenes]GAE22564.1 hypothetical protein JCM10003_2186 [Bacteroides pyogenes JCM 10003]SUV32030.1 transposase IS116/IS110/IS902 family protein [Bacteroides pyogenes]
MTYIGIDISKSTFVAAFPSRSSYRTETFRNEAKGICKFIGKLSADTPHCMIQTIGNYGFCSFLPS